jgi:hypothetical protein
VGVGYFATAVFANGLASATAAQSQRYFIGIPASNVPSDTDGWFQIGGPYIGVVWTTQDFYINCNIKWTGAAILCSSSGYFAQTVATDSLINTFAVSLSSISQGTYDWYLFGDPIGGMS